METVVSTGLDFFATVVFFIGRLKFVCLFCCLIALFELFLFLTSGFFLVPEDSAAAGFYFSSVFVHMSLNMVASDYCLSIDLMQSKLASFFFTLCSLCVMGG